MYPTPIDPKIIEMQRRYNSDLQLRLDGDTLAMRRRRIWWKPWTWFSLVYRWRV